ncbi:MAG: A/G-specific adenine glycosylase [Bdellovibrionaceae bacterium]|nr:A/G-specific adenine glycosylase [Pseudobdellovibrionaceae bacterium]|tara:strand:- start:19344 stop:20321 length:978 start_codon:yes stop_codon:yes gene_type:complete
MKPSLSNKKKLLAWYSDHQRDLPWRHTTDPYSIWISEIMLQQTTATAVIPFYNRFLEALPTVESLAKAKQEEVYALWAGLGYYSRARNLQKAAKLIVQLGHFPKTFSDLIELPGLGPYTSRAVSSFAFGESVGVLDGNVIRFLSRFENLPLEWWKTRERNQLQELADQWVANVNPSLMNQALMEIGSTQCLPKNPKCLICPLMKSCKAQADGVIDSLPLKKPKRQKELWSWNAYLVKKGKRVATVINDYSPFLKGQRLLPGKSRRLKVKPKTSKYKHHITHHEIFVTVHEKDSSILDSYNDVIWVEQDEIKKHVPFSLVHKVFDS